MNFPERICSLCQGLEIQRQVALDRYTTLRVGGPADWFAEPETAEQLRLLLCAAREENMAVLLLGNGSNILMRDGGFRGLVIHLGKKFASVRAEGTRLVAQAGALLSTLARTAQAQALTGLEFAQGIPGTVGGGVYMNAGAYGGELGQVISAVRVLDGETILQVPAEEMDFAYRHTRAMEKQWIILEAEFQLQRGDPRAIEAAMQDFAARRREKQPLEYPSAGSFFKRPAGYFAGKLIEDAHLKGFGIGGAQVSEKHAGFLINRGGATAADFIALKDEVQRRVAEQFGVQLEPEVRILGSDT